MKKSSLIALSLMIGLILVPAFITYQPLQAAEYDYEASLNLPLGYWLDVLNPTSSTTAYDWDVLGLIYDGLETVNPFDYFNPDADIPLLLSEPKTFEIVEDATYGRIGKWTIKLRQGVTFHDGHNLTADDYVFTVEFVKWLGEASEPWYEVGAYTINVTKVDDYTIYHYTTYTGLMYALSALPGIIFPKHIFEVEDNWGHVDDNDNDVFPDWDITPDAIVSYAPSAPDDPILTGYGPFYLKSWNRETFGTSDQIVLERYDYYFMRAIDEEGNVLVPWKQITEDYIDLHGPYVKRIVYKVIIEPADLVSAVTKREVDMAEEFEFAGYINDLKAAGLSLTYADRLGFGHITFNCKSSTQPLIQEAVFRRALAFAIDKEAVIENVWYGYAVPLDVPVPKSMGDWSIEYNYTERGFTSYYTASPDLALQELAKLGIEDTDDDGILEDPDGNDVEITIIGTATSSVRRIVDTVADAIRAIGIIVNTQYLDFNTLLSRVRAGNFEIAFFGFGLGRLPGFLLSFTSGHPTNQRYWRWSNATYDEAVDNMFNAENWTAAKRWAWKAQEILYYEQPLTPIYQNRIVGAYDADVWKGVVSYPAGSALVNGWTIMHVVKVKVAPPAPAFPMEYAIAGVVIIIVIIGAALFLTRRGAAPAA